MTTTRIEPSPRTRAYVAWVLRWGKVLWFFALLLSLWTTLRTAELYGGLRSELELLLPQEAPSVQALHELRRRMPGIQHLGVVVDAGIARNLPAAERLVDDLAARILRYPSDLVFSVRKDIAEERAFLDRNALLYVQLADLRSIRERVEARRDWEVSSAMGSNLLDDDEPAPSLDFSDIEKRYRERDLSADRFQNGRFTSAGAKASVLLVEIAGYSTGTDKAAQIMDRIRDDVARLGGTDAYGPGMQVAFTGNPAISVEELSALIVDLTFSSLVIILLVVGVLALYFRWWRAVPAILLPLLLSTTYSFALARLLGVTELNSNTAFLGSIIVGNGVNFGIILTARYVEERRAGAEVGEALAWAVHGTRVGTVTAAAAAGIAYGSLMVTQFRGFWQFGVIGGIGMLMCWTVTFLLTPSLLAWFDSSPSAAPRSLPSRTKLSPIAALAQIVSRFPRAFVAGGVAITIAAAIGSAGFGPDRIETDFSKMRRRDTWQVGEGYWGRRMDAVLGRYLTPVVILTDSARQTREVAAAVRAEAQRDPLARIVASVRTVDDVIPPDQDAKLAETNKLRRVLTPRMRAQIPAERREYVDKLLSGDDPTRVTAAELPPTFTAGMLERDGSLDKAVLVYPKTTRDTWQGEVILGFAERLRAIAARFPSADGRVPRVAGSAPLSSDIVASMVRDGPLATMVAVAGVLSLVLATFRFRRETLLVVGSLLVGVLWLVWATIVLDVRINFANFIGFPITFGIGVDYAVNVMWRYKLDGGRDVLGAIKSTGGAVGLCSATTIIGYSSLLLAKNQALFSFGLVAVLGELTCLFTGVALLPAVLLLLDRRKGSRQ
ncbi:MAG: MMPL family transporter [Polyangiaceae bacterium]|nr:MMPL family transporter [Polyangiaceae bacterium]